MTSGSTQPQAATPNICTSNGGWRTIARLAISYHECQQSPLELAALLQYLDEVVRPVTVLEIGGYAGGSAWAWACLQSVERIITVTLPDSPMLSNGFKLDIDHVVIPADSRQHATVNEVYNLAGPGQIDYLFIDGNHTLEYVQADFRNYAPMVRPGGLIAMHDINYFENHLDLDVHVFWRELTRVHRTSELVQFPGGENGTGLVYL